MDFNEESNYKNFEIGPKCLGCGPFDPSKSKTIRDIWNLIKKADQDIYIRNSIIKKFKIWPKKKKKQEALKSLNRSPGLIASTPNKRLTGTSITHLVKVCFSRALNLTRNCPTILTREDFGGTYHKDHFSDCNFLSIYYSFQEICWKL